MSIESDDLVKLRETTSKTLIAVLWVHVPIAMIIGMVRGADWLLPVALMATMATAATVSWRTAGNSLSTRLIVAVALPPRSTPAAAISDVSSCTPGFF